MGRNLLRAGLAAALAALLLPGARPAPAAAAKPLVLRDPPCGDPAIPFSDALEVRVEAVEEGLEFRVRMGAPLEKGIATVVEVRFDADDDPKTGMDGDEIRFRAAVGSRFRPNDAAATPGGPAALESRLLSWSDVLLQHTLGRKEPAQSWLNRGLRERPEVEGSTIRFTVPRNLLERGTEWASREVAFRLTVETSIADRPLLVDHVAADDGLPILLDGEDGDWSGAREDRDPGGELHPAFRHLDLTRLRVDHEAKRLLVCIETAKEGFAERMPPTPDLYRSERITVLAEPVDADYEAPRRFHLWRGFASRKTEDGEQAAKGRIVEAALPRSGLEPRTRVLAWSEATLRDTVPDGDRDRARFPLRAR